MASDTIHQEKDFKRKFFLRSVHFKTFVLIGQYSNVNVYEN